MQIIITLFFFFFLTLNSCNSKQAKAEETEMKTSQKIKIVEVTADSIQLSKKHKPNFILCDLDGDKLTDTVQMVLNNKNEKYGLKIILGNKQLQYFGLGQKVLGQDFDDLNWVDILEKAPKEEVYYNNVNEDGEIVSEAEIKEEDKIKLPNDGIFIHAAESCGGGIMYLNNGKFEWIQQE